MFGAVRTIGSAAINFAVSQWRSHSAEESNTRKLLWIGAGVAALAAVIRYPRTTAVALLATRAMMSPASSVATAAATVAATAAATTVASTAIGASLVAGAAHASSRAIPSVVSVLGSLSSGVGAVCGGFGALLAGPQVTAPGVSSEGDRVQSPGFTPFHKPVMADTGVVPRELFEHAWEQPALDPALSALLDDVLLESEDANKTPQVVENRGLLEAAWPLQQPFQQDRAPKISGLTVALQPAGNQELLEKAWGQPDLQTAVELPHGEETDLDKELSENYAGSQGSAELDKEWLENYGEPADLTTADVSTKEATVEEVEEPNQPQKETAADPKPLSKQEAPMSLYKSFIRSSVPRARL